MAPTESFILLFFFFYVLRTSSVGGALPDFFFILFSFPCSADHERDWPPCKVVFFGLATNTLNVRNNTMIGGCAW